MLRVGRGKESIPLGDDEFDALVREYEDVVVDLGTGDGRFVLRTARERRRSLVIGIDPVQDAMADVARRVVREAVSRRVCPMPSSCRERGSPSGGSARVAQRC